MRSKSLILILLMSITMIASGNATADDVHGVMQVVKGDVQIKSAKDGKINKAKMGSKVFPKDTIITGKDSRAKIVMVDNNVLNISPDSKIEIKTYEYNPAAGKKDVLLNVLYGKIRSKVEQKYDGAQNKFQVKTPTAVAGVRGTDFLASYSRSTRTSQVVTFRGEVAFGQIGINGRINNPVAITPGLSSSTSGGQASAPTPVPPGQLAAIDRDSSADTAQAEQTPRAPANNIKKEKRNEPKNDKQPQGDEPGASNGQPKEGDSSAVGGDSAAGNENAANGNAAADGGKKDAGNKSDGDKNARSDGNRGAANSTDANKGAGNSDAKSPGAGDASKGATNSDPKSGGASASAGSPPPATAGADGNKAGTPATVRSPASTGTTSGPAAPASGSMLRSSDFASAPNSTVMPTMTNIMPAVPVAPGVLPPNGGIPVCTTCQQFIQNGTTTLKINVQ